MSTAEKIEKDWDGCHIAELQLEELEDVPEIAYKLGIVPHDWKNETAGIWADSELEETVPFRGSSFDDASGGPLRRFVPFRFVLGKLGTGN